MRKRIGNYLSQQQGRILTFVLGLVVVIFIGILVTAYIIAKRADGCSRHPCRALKPASR